MVGRQVVGCSQVPQGNVLLSDYCDVPAELGGAK